MKTEEKEENILEEANRIIHGQRNDDYGTPFDDFSKTAKIWEVILGVDKITPEQIALCMIGVKMSRLRNTADHRDSIVDIAGYAGTYEMVVKERARRNAIEKPDSRPIDRVASGLSKGIDYDKPTTVEGNKTYVDKDFDGYSNN